MLTLMPKNLIKMPIGGQSAWCKILADANTDIDLRRFDGYALVARFNSIDRPVRLNTGAFLFLASKCDGPPANPRYRYRLYYCQENDDGDGDDELIDVTEELGHAHNLTRVLNDVLDLEECPAALVQIRNEDSMFANKAAFAVAANTIYRAALVAYLTLTNMCTLEGPIVHNLVATDIENGGSSLTRNPLPPKPAVPYRPGQRRRKVDRVPQKDDPNEFMP